MTPERLSADQLSAPALVDTAVWTWARDRRFPDLADWFNAEARSGRILICDLIVLELTRLAPNEQRANAVHDRLAGFSSVPMGEGIWKRAREVQIGLASGGDHRRVPPADLLIAASAEAARVPLVHYDRDYERISAVSGQEQRWFVPAGSLSG